MARHKRDEIERVSTTIQLTKALLSQVKHLSVDRGEPIYIIIEEALIKYLKSADTQGKE